MASPHTATSRRPPEEFHRHLTRVLNFNRSLPPTDPATPTVPLKVRVGSWPHLGVGLHPGRGTLAFVPAPNTGQIVSVANGVRLDLGGLRWKAVFDLASRSANGRTVPDAEFVSQVRGKGKPPADADYFSNTWSDLRRDLAATVDGPETGPAVLFIDRGDTVNLGFTARGLLTNDECVYTFGLPP